MVILTFFDKVEDEICIQTPPDPCENQHDVKLYPFVNLVSSFSPLLASSHSSMSNVFFRFCSDTRQFGLVVTGRALCTSEGSVTSPIHRFYQHLETWAPSLEKAYLQLLFYRSIAEVFCDDLSAKKKRQEIVTELKNTVQKYQNPNDHQTYSYWNKLVNGVVVMLYNLDRYYAKELYDQLHQNLFTDIMTQLYKYGFKENTTEFPSLQLEKASFDVYVMLTITVQILPF